MRQIGLLGGTSWPSTIEYYRILNLLAQEKFAGHHSAKILLWSMDYHDIKSHYHAGWDIIPSVLERELNAFARCKPECILICNNTLHEALDKIRPRLEFKIPIFHMVDLVAKRALEAGIKKVLLLGTKYTMEHSYYSGRLREFGLEVVTPTLSERERIQEIQSQIARGELSPGFVDGIRKIIAGYESQDAVVTACTELPLVVTPAVTALPIFDPMKVQCEAAFEFAIT